MALSILARHGAALAVAAGMVFSPGAMAAGVYAGVSVGNSKVQEESPTGERYDGYGAGSAGLFGGFSFGEIFAVEAGLRNYGHFSVDTASSNVETDLYAFTVGPVLRLPVGRDLRLTGRLDYVDWQIEQSENGYTAYQENGETVGLALGFEADITRSFGLRAGVDVFGFETADGYQQNVTNFNIGAQFMF